MKSISELRKILSVVPFNRIDAHVHTHLCDGKPEMTVENVMKRAEEKGLKAVIFTPHFHKRLKDDTAELYADTDDRIFVRLREEIEAYQKASLDPLTVLLSVEADILDTDGRTSLTLSKEAEDALDLTTPTLNFHPLLPLKAVEVTMGRTIAEIHGSGLYRRYAEAAGGTERILETLYTAEENAILKSQYPAIVGHFFAAHSYAVGKYSWFAAKPQHLELMKQGAERVLNACGKTGSMVDLTGIHPEQMTNDEKREADGFFREFQTWFIAECQRRNVPAFPGSDAHSLRSVGNVGYYGTFLQA